MWLDWNMAILQNCRVSKMILALAYILHCLYVAKLQLQRLKQSPKKRILIEISIST